MSTTQSKESQMRQLFDSISPRYDLFNRISSLGQDCRWRKKSIQLGQLKEGMTILDVGVGTAGFSLCAAEKVGPKGKIFGMDISPQMLELGCEKMKRTMTPFMAILARAEEIPLSPSSVDRILMAFTLRNVSDVHQTLQECLQVLKKSGKLIILEITRPPNQLLERIYRFYMRGIVPEIGRRLCGMRGPFDYLNESVMQFQSPHEIANEMYEVGFRQTQIFSLTLGAVHVIIASKNDRIEGEVF